jgi:hypothetical protein
VPLLDELREEVASAAEFAEHIDLAIARITGLS